MKNEDMAKLLKARGVEVSPYGIYSADDCGGHYKVSIDSIVTVWKYFNYSHYVRTEDEADRLLKDLLERGKLREGWTSNDGTTTHPWVVRGIKKKK